jgi:hypothetical protein
MTTTTTTTSQHRTVAQRLARWAVPSALLLAATTMGPAHATLSPGDVGAFDPGVACSGTGSTVDSSGTGEQLRLSRLVNAAHAASVHAAR